MSAAAFFLILAGAAFALFMLDAWQKPSASTRAAWALALVGLLGALWAVPSLAPALEFFGRGLLVWDKLSVMTAWIAGAAAFLTILLAVPASRQTIARPAVFNGLLLLSLCGSILAAAANDFLMLFIAIELATLPSFALVGFSKARRESIEAALKFFLLGAFSSALLVYGVSLLYGLSGTTLFTTLDLAALDAQRPLLMTAVLFVLAGLCFKAALVPFHWWLPEAFEQAPVPVSAYISVAPKIAAVAVLIRLFNGPWAEASPTLFSWLALLAALSMTFGNLMGLLQTNVLRLMAYSSVSHVGFLVTGLLAGATGVTAFYFYAGAYLFMNIGAFAVLGIVLRSSTSADLSALQGLSRRSPFLAASMTIFLLSLAGLPPLAGFTAKFSILAALFNAGWIKLSILGLANAVIACAYYFKILHTMYFQAPTTSEMTAPDKPHVTERFVLAVTTFAVLLMGLAPQLVFTLLGHVRP